MKKILVIEDAQSLRKDILEMLGFEGYDASGAENGLVGVKKARELRPDLIICDIMMPGLDGYGVLETLRHDPDTATIPFIFLTARTDRVDMRQGMELGADDYLPKPFTAAELLNTVKVRLQKHAEIQEQANRKMSVLRGNIILALPHELRTPLNIILGFSDLLMTDAGIMDAPRIADMARHINGSGMRLLRLVENFLTYAHTEILLSDDDQRASLRNHYMLYPKSALESYVVKHAEDADRRADLLVDVQDVDAISTSEDDLKKMIEEVIDNAFKFSDEGKPVSVTARVEDNYYVVRIADQGRGMAQEQIDSVGAYMQFERRMYEQQGTGLGLVIAKRLAEFHGGQLEIVSEVGRGTEVAISMPLRHDVALPG